MLSARDLLWAAEGRRMLLVNRVADETDLQYVSCDSIAGTRAVADHFHECGVRRVAYVGGLAHTVIARERRDAFITRIAEHGMTLTDAVHAGEYSYLAGWLAGGAGAIPGEAARSDFLRQRRPGSRRGMDALRKVRGLASPRHAGGWL
ncbi:hypothetical protein [Falsiroseomonas sp. HW251]|uniref:hypothetical protein n=1 Tax=Falsiroseomonas sp. HW251 TaxID=3390998 RepID=UPI003D316437